jgi:hypothetical protein
MKCAVLGESAADEMAVRVLVDAVLQCPTERMSGPHLRGRGWPSVLQAAPGVLKHLYYQTDCDGLVVVADSNSSPLHGPRERRCDAPSKCRLCGLRSALERANEQLRPMAGRAPIRFAVGLAVPAIEGWLRCGLDPRVSEASWRDGLASGRLPFDKRALKRDVYGTDRPGLALETERAVREAKRVASDLPALRLVFPAGFGALEEGLLSW